MQNQQPSEENEDLMRSADDSINSDDQKPSQPLPSPSYYQMTTEWVKETGKLAYEGLNAYTAMKIISLWGAAAFAVQIAAENKYSEEVNSTGLVAGAVGVLGSTYTILRDEAYRLRLSDRNVKIEQAVVPPVDELRKQLESATAELVKLRRAARVR